MKFGFPAVLLPGLILAVSLLSGCAGIGAGGFGRLSLSTSAAELFESGTVLPDHAYYYSGPDMNPNAVIAIHRNYTLETRFWKPVEATAKQLRDWVDMMTDFRGFGFRTLGSDILGPRGEHIGIWYSKKTDITTVRLLEDSRVMVYPPAAYDKIRRWPWERKLID